MSETKSVLKDPITILKEQMAKYPGAQRRTAQIYNCSVQWVWNVLNEKVNVSPVVLEKITNCAWEAIDQIRQEEINKVQSFYDQSSKLLNKIQELDNTSPTHTPTNIKTTTHLLRQQTRENNIRTLANQTSALKNEVNEIKAVTMELDVRQEALRQWHNDIQSTLNQLALGLDSVHERLDLLEERDNTPWWKRLFKKH